MFLFLNQIKYSGKQRSHIRLPLNNRQECLEGIDTSMHTGNPSITESNLNIVALWRWQEYYRFVVI
jgi:hypothetical protein